MVVQGSDRRGWWVWWGRGGGGKITLVLKYIRYSVFEVDGKNKRGSQLPKASRSEYVVKDDILDGSKRIIPIHLFGFLY